MSDRFDHTLEHKLESKPSGGDGEVGHVRRLELITGTGRRRRWSDDDKARIIVESLQPGANVSAVARRHGLSPQHLFGWRREARTLFSEGASMSDVVRTTQRDVAPAFAPVVLAAAAPPAPAGSGEPPSPRRADAGGLIEIAIGEAVVRIRGKVEADVLAVVLAVVRKAP